jgi:hypothetical protein
MASPQGRSKEKQQKNGAGEAREQWSPPFLERGMGGMSFYFLEAVLE